MTGLAHHPDHLVHSAPERDYETLLMAAIVVLTVLGLAAIGILMATLG